MSQQQRPPEVHAGSDPDPGTIYRDRVAHYAELRTQFAGQWDRVANLRLVLFGALLLAGGVAVWRPGVASFTVTAALAVGFIVAVVVHRRLGRTRQRYDNLTRINAEGLLRLARDWSKLPLRAPAPPTDPQSVAYDLDLLGHASTQHLLNTPRTSQGQSTLQNWLLAPAAAAIIRDRQTAVAELAPLLDFRDDLAVAGEQIEPDAGAVERFLHWATAPVWFRREWRLVLLARVVPVLTCGLLLAWSLGLIRYPIWVAGIVVNAVLLLTAGRQVDAVIDQVSARHAALQSYARLFALLRNNHWRSARLQQIEATLQVGQIDAAGAMGRLALIVAFGDLRFWMFYFPVKLLTLWNFHVLYALEGWQAMAGGRVAGWLAALGETEALAALATLKYEQPTWSLPVVEQSSTQIVAQELGHPLLPDRVRVTNSFEVGPTGTFILVTGSNMSGKSTLLRALGQNVVLAQAGGPVCATQLVLPPARLATSMRVQDSLEHGVSYFMAELQRLKRVVDAARATEQAAECRLLFLLDEILHGTNTGERRIAARQIIHYLVQHGAIGMVSTHDLALADDPVLAPAARLIHFAETWSDGPDGLQMRFDYRLQPGIATSTNALKLMQLIGLPLDAPDVATPAA